MKTPGSDDRSFDRRAFDEALAAQPPLPPPELPAGTTPMPAESYLHQTSGSMGRRDHHREDLNQVRCKRDRLGSSSYVGRALTDELLGVIEHRIETASEPDLSWGFWPFVYSLFVLRDEEALAGLDADIDLVLSRTDPARRGSITKFLHPSDRGAGPWPTGPWFGGLFEVWCKATFLRKGTEVQLDITVPNGRDHDLSAVVGGHRLHFECTVLTQDDEGREVWERYMEQLKLDPNQVLIRPGPLCPKKAKGPSPYYETLRLYAKVYDKLTKNLDPAKSQFGMQQRNVLLTCFAGPNVGSDYPSTRWGFEELFVSHPQIARRVCPESFTDISLEAWADFTARHLIEQKRLSAEWYCENSHLILEAPRQLGGAMLFDDSRLAGGRINYAAAEECVVSHADMAELERLLANPTKYF